MNILLLFMFRVKTLCSWRLSQESACYPAATFYIIIQFLLFIMMKSTDSFRVKNTLLWFRSHRENDDFLHLTDSTPLACGCVCVCVCGMLFMRRWAGFGFLSWLNYETLNTCLSYCFSGVPVLPILHIFLLLIVPPCVHKRGKKWE